MLVIFGAWSWCSHVTSHSNIGTNVLIWMYRQSTVALSSRRDSTFSVLYFWLIAVEQNGVEMNARFIMLASFSWFRFNYVATLIFRLWRDGFSVSTVFNIDSVEVFFFLEFCWSFIMLSVFYSQLERHRRYKCLFETWTT